MTSLVEFKSDINRLIEAKELALPSNVSADAFRNAAIIAVQDNPKILSCDRGSVMKSIRSLAAAGLVPDGREAALVPFKTYIDGSFVDVCQDMPMVFGLTKMVRRSGQIADIRAHIVYQNEVDQDRFSYIIGDTEELRHEPILFGDKGPPVAAYAIAIMKDGSFVREFMGADEIDNARRSSAAQKIYEKGKKPVVSDKPIGIWETWWAEMWKKTVIRRICKRLDMSSEDLRRIQIEEEPDIKDVTPPKRAGFADTVKAARAAAAAPEPEPEPDQDIEDAELVPEEESHWTLAIDVSDAFPGSDEFTEGMKARDAGMKREMCPHEDDNKKAADWLGGFDQKGKSNES